tara:strand:+ start:37 stop:612 length:576 start_codon:yes stop_codon:yes gene_type:complete
MELDALFHEAKVAFHKMNAAKVKAKSEPPKPQEINTLFTDPANWTRGRGIALIHQETDTLLGNFSEWHHRTGARSLRPETLPISVSATEYVSGGWWVAEPEAPRARSADFTKQELTLPLELDRMGVYALSATVCVWTAPTGGFARVELIAETLFAGKTNGELLWLPAGTNILPAMSHATKLAMRTLNEALK